MRLAAPNYLKYDAMKIRLVLLLLITGCWLTVEAQSQRTEIAPLLQTQWGQDDPYNLQCPVKSGKHCQTGCVATAMAQIMYYHRWPAEGYDWDNMLPTYTGSETEAQQAAVAKLMHDCGVAVDMEYGVVTSAAFEGDAAVALVRDFGYAETAQEVFAFYYTREEWEELIYNELAEGRPVFYGGMPAGFLHQFVCDGYKDGKFHFNMAWTFKPDGWYTLDEISLFPDSHTAIIGVKKAEGSGVAVAHATEPVKGAAAHYYTLDGIRLATAQKGLNIVKTAEATAKIVR